MMRENREEQQARALQLADGPIVATPEDIPELNGLFTEAFSDRYRRDGMTGVRVPPLNRAIWRYAIEDAGGGALIWRDARGRVAAFNMAHKAGAEGWMGPLCVRPDMQGMGLGTRIVEAGMQWLRAQQVRVIGLETMPRTMDNIGFYSRLGFVPGYCTLTLTLDAAPGDRAPTRLSQLPRTDQPVAMAGCRVLTEHVLAGYDFTREIALTQQLQLGETVLLGRLDAPAGFALCHTVPLVEGRASDELRVLKLVLARRSDWPAMQRTLTDLARRVGARRIAVRLQGEYPDVYRTMIASGARVRWSDLRMSAYGATEIPPADGMVLSNWEI